MAAQLFALIAAVSITISIASAEHLPRSSSAAPQTLRAHVRSKSAKGAALSDESRNSIIAGTRSQTTSAQSVPYVRPDFHQRVQTSLVSTFGPVQMATLVFGSAISQADNVPPEWRQGWGAYGKRFASHLGSSAAAGTANLLLGEALREDTKYYPCTCKGVWPRLKHAFASSITARAGEDGHRVFSIPAIASPYAGAFSTLAWYPSRYTPQDAFRTGSYNLLNSAGTKIALEFLTPVFRKIHHR